MAKNATQPWTTSGDEKRALVQDMFADISGSYDLLNSTMSFRLHHRWRRFAVSLLKLAPGETVADVCCGTGDFGSPLRNAIGKSGKIIGVDFCLPMLSRARDKKVDMSLASGDACRLPIQSNSVDAVTVGWGIRNVADIPAALKEIHRILKPNGRWVSLDMAIPRNKIFRSMSRGLLNRGLPFLGSLIGKKTAYTYLPQSTRQFATREEFIGLMEAAGFRNCRYNDLFFGTICAHYGEK